ncbi:MAG: LAGLIDADG family homing endonuclease [Nitrososphaerota archaeon]|nr:LAGLIDADG family homing endonuclease [Nitrososphaerota archaeon]
MKPSKIGWPPSKRDLEELYNRSEMSVHRIARLTGRGYGTVHYWMSKYSLARRGREDASRAVTRRYPVRRFTGDENERAYLFGISLGDLYVRRHHKSIEVYTSTSVPSMVELVVDVFARYARAKVSPTVYKIKGTTIGGWRVRVLLDLSFSFLLGKYSTPVPDWVLASEGVFRSFLAGLFDAEGHAGVYLHKRHRGGAVTQLTVTNTNLKLIRRLHSLMKAKGFHPQLSTEQTSRSVWHQLKFERRREIQELLKTIPFRHPKKKIVGRLLLKIPLSADAQSSSRIIDEFKSLRQTMKEDDRRQGLEAIFAIANGERRQEMADTAACPGERPAPRASSLQLT